jgi:hypothetical protein
MATRSASLGVRLLAVVVAVGGLKNVVDAAALGLGGGTVGLVAGAVLLAWAVVVLATAAGLWTLEPYAWTAAVGIYAVNLGFDLLTADLLGLLWDGSTLVYLFQQRDQFRR